MSGCVRELFARMEVRACGIATLLATPAELKQRLILGIPATSSVHLRMPVHCDAPGCVRTCQE